MRWVLALLALTGCTYTTGTASKDTLQFTSYRVFNSTALNATLDPATNTWTIGYSSDPNAQAMAQVAAAIQSALQAGIAIGAKAVP